MHCSVCPHPQFDTLERTRTDSCTMVQNVHFQHRAPPGASTGQEPFGRLFLSSRMHAYKGVRNGTWSRMEIADFLGFNTSDYFQSFQARNCTEDKPILLSVVNTTATFCVQGTVKIEVGESRCNSMYKLRETDSPPLLLPPNVYFVCGFQGYVWLLKGWSGTCYLSYLLPPYI